MRSAAAIMVVSILLAGCGGHHAVISDGVTVIESSRVSTDQASSTDGETWLIDGTSDGAAQSEPTSPRMIEGAGLTVSAELLSGDPLNTAQAENLDPNLLYEMGRQYMEGDGVEVNADIAMHYLGLAKDLGHVEAKRVMAILALRADPADVTALAELEEAALTSPKAKAQYGMMLANMAIPRLNNLPRGMDLLHQAHAEGSHEAAFALYLWSKTNAPGDASDYLHAAAERGNPKAVAELAHAQAYAAPKEKSLKWIRAAMANNDPQAMFDYANSLMIGRYSPVLEGYPQNREFEAFYWFKKSADLGYSPAATEVDNLQGVAAAMNKLQIDVSSLDQALQPSPQQ